MGFKPRFTKADIRKVMDQKMSDIRNSIITRLSFVGDEFVKMARNKTASEGGFNDKSGNLRSSIGFVVLDHGRIVTEGFETFVNGSEGTSEAKKLTKELANDFSDGYALIVVAGMDYAAALENRHHKDVITGSSLIAETMLKQALARLKDKASRL